MQMTSAETNVASIASFLGLPVKVLTTFVKGSPVARMIKDNLRSRNMAFEVSRCRRADRGATGTSSTSPTAATVRAGRACGMTARGKSGGP